MPHPNRKLEQWRCLCECGNETLIKHPQMGYTKSCGCALRDGAAARKGKPNMKQRLPDDIAPFNHIVASYRSEARNRGKSWDLSHAQAIAMFKSSCYYCGKPPGLRTVKTRNREFFCGGIDRMNPDVGYQEDNCVPCCRKCNLGKHSMLPQEFVRRAEAVYKHMTEQDANNES